MRSAQTGRECTDSRDGRYEQLPPHQRPGPRIGGDSRDGDGRQLGGRRPRDQGCSQGSYAGGDLRAQLSPSLHANGGPAQQQAGHGDAFHTRSYPPEKRAREWAAEPGDSRARLGNGSVT
eukprot:CAMPEP_0179895706 /NCGR_PEP_ID=MMETSP0982-20121206/35970_1 /TAXON_ID=483367 /ORGANISM="non described non described, Strain CCMP 2436" /LENGTH=119 /DNA_ID=CAMNT_0021792397 /DNA_START=144 /DNA_END=500 /DNA_ORIENTATION=+